MAKLRIFIVIFIVWVILLFNVERYDPFNINIPSSLYVLSAIGLLPILLVPAIGQFRFEIAVTPILVSYIGVRYFGIFSATTFTISAVATECLVLIITLWIGRKISINLNNFESIIDNVVFEHESSRILPMVEGEQAVASELFRARKYERPVAILYFKLPSIVRLQQLYPQTFQYQLLLEQRYYKTRIARIVESMIYRVDIMTWFGDNLVICLPETEFQQADQLAKTLAKIIDSSIMLKVPIGIATFPSDGYIFTDLIEWAEQHVKIYTSDDMDKYDWIDPNPPDFDDDIPTDVDNRIQVMWHNTSNMWHKTIKNLKHVVTLFMNDIELMPTREYQDIDRGNYRLYHDPDHWVNRIPYQATSSRRIYDYIKRPLDICIVLASLPFALLVMLCVAIAIKWDDGGSILYSQERTGLGGHKFKMFKFRSMIEIADQHIKELGVTANERNETVDAFGAKLTNDPRITRVGHIIRKTSLDELPQLWNVLKGDMSLVGPRPTSFSVDKYHLYHTQRLSVRPGITGLWQIYDRGDTDFDNRLIWDIKYIDKYSLSMDINIILRSVIVVLKKTGA